MAILAAGALTVGYASTPRFWLISNQAELLKGEVERLSIDDAGRVVLAPSVRPIFESTAPFIWCLAAGADGAVYAGGGNDGQVWRVDTDGKTTEFFRAKEMEIHALAAAPDGALYAASSPDGKVYRLDAQGHASVAFDPGDKYIWSLAIDREGRLYVGTGDKGIVYRVSRGGTGEVFYRTNARNVTSMAFDRDGQLLVATDSPGRVLRIDTAGKAFALVDSPFREMRAIRVAADGTIFAAAVNGKSAPGDGGTPAPAAPEPPKSSTPGVTAEIMSVTVIDVSGSASSQASAPPRAAERAGSKGAVYRIETDGTSDIVWESKDDVPFDLAVDADGLTIGTGNGGKLFRVAGSPAHTSLVTRVGGQQITALLPVRRVRYLATSNPGRIVIAGDARSADGSYVSDVRDAGMTATWGTITWRAFEKNGSRVQVMTRSGNTSAPDDTWSAWSPAYSHADGDAIISPAARYLQWKAVLAGAPADADGPALMGVRVGYQQRNARPSVTSITVLPPGTVFQRPFPTGEPEIAGLAETAADARLPLFSLPQSAAQAGGATGRRLYQKGLQSFTWKADDDNDDRLSCDVYYRAVDSREWRVLRRGLTDGLLTWDTTSVPDGTYVIKVVASDAPANPPAQALSGELESDAFDVDNTPPALSVVSVTMNGTNATVLVEARDSHSAIGAVEYSVDAARWQPLFPVDGIADRMVERYAITVSAAMVDRVMVRAADVLNNATALKVQAGSRK